MSHENPVPVRFEVRGKVIDLESLPPMARRILEKHAARFSQKYAHVVGPMGERPTVVLRKPDLMGRRVEVILEFPESLKDSIRGAEKAVRVA
jgi:hypothetical protein